MYLRLSRIAMAARSVFVVRQRGPVRVVCGMSYGRSKPPDLVGTHERLSPSPAERGTDPASASALRHRQQFIRTRSVAINRAVPNIRSDRPAETRDFLVDLLGFEVAMDMGWVVTLASPTNPSAQVTIIGNDDPAAPGISVEVDDVDAVHAKAVEQGLEIPYPLRDEEWGVRRFMLREPSGMTVNVLSHRSR
jgi:catechol 2,3-dioxygenase-like lactoylglutathione lyase family enzyme